MRRVNPFVIAVCWAILILLLSTVGVGVNLPASWMDFFSWDKLAHAFVYGVLTYWLVLGFQKTKSWTIALVFATLISGLYGVLMEGIQYWFFPNRFFELLDILANIVGILICAICVVIRKQRITSH